MATPHNEANKGDIAKIVLTSGDPKRCEHIANKYLENVILVNSVRGMTAYTGYYKGKKITIFPSGMGMPSMGIYCYELYKFYDVETIIRMGTCGGINPDLDVLDVILLESSYTESNYALTMNRDPKTYIVNADEFINQKLEQTLKEEQLPYQKGVGLCSDFFDPYLSEENYRKMLNNLPKNLNFLGMEMEAFALFYIAKLLNKKAACILTVSDSRERPDAEISSEDRIKKLDNMIEIVLKTSLKL